MAEDVVARLHPESNNNAKRERASSARLPRLRATGDKGSTLKIVDMNENKFKISSRARKRVWRG